MITTPSSYSHHFPHTNQLSEGIISCLLGPTTTHTHNNPSPPHLPSTPSHVPGAV